MSNWKIWNSLFLFTTRNFFFGKCTKPKTKTFLEPSQIVNYAPQVKPKKYERLRYKKLVSEKKKMTVSKYPWMGSNIKSAYTVPY